jgi:phosphomannomutase
VDRGLYDSARRWIDDDPDADTQAQGEAIVTTGDEGLIRSHFGRHLSFGTAGMRGALGPGPNRMNRSMVMRVTAAVARYASQTIENACDRGAIIGFDGRYGSREFADAAAQVLVAAGFRVFLFNDVRPTPRLAHGLKTMGCSFGIMITASHNPPQDNGYKLYWDDGAQIIPPVDIAVSTELLKIHSTASIPSVDEKDARLDGRLVPVPLDVQEQYFDAVSRLRVYDQETNLSIVYSAMHGVGRASVERVLTTHGYQSVHCVAEQADPDPDFPTVAFPNPEEPGAMDLSLALARRVNADLVLANDPDADRLCVAVPHKGQYVLLSGNEVGVLLADELLTHGDFGDDPLTVTTIVSTSMLEKVAHHHGADYTETLTGFKWLAQAALQHEATGGRFVMGFEEALGYSIGPVVKDKDGISAALVFADLAARCKSEGSSVMGRLEGLYRRHGLHLTAQMSFKFPGDLGQEKMLHIMAQFRANPPQKLDESELAFRRDYQNGTTTICATNEVQQLDLPSSNVLGFHMVNGSRLMVRPSGTEPKIKFYFEVCESVHPGELIESAHTRAQSRLEYFMESAVAPINLLQ